jgi:hypothetical protein
MKERLLGDLLAASQEDAGREHVAEKGRPQFIKKGENLVFEGMSRISTGAVGGAGEAQPEGELSASGNRAAMNTRGIKAGLGTWSNVLTY